MNLSNYSQKAIIKKLQKYEKEQLLKSFFYSLKQIDLKESKTVPIWFYFLLIKWTYLYGSKSKTNKNFTDEAYRELLIRIEKFEDSVQRPYIDNHNWEDFFRRIGYQQFYLQLEVHWSIFARQLRIYDDSQSSKYSINSSFKNKTGISIVDFIFFMNIVWLFTQANKMEKGLIYYTGYIGEEIFEMMEDKWGKKEEFDKFINLLKIDEVTAVKCIKDFNTGVKSVLLEPFEKSFFTKFPFRLQDGRYEIVHRSIFNYCCHYYIYDYLKNSDDKFTEEFGKRFENYVELGLKESNTKYITENDIRNTYGREESVVDYIVDDSVLIECKGIEPKPLASILPENKIIHNSFKDSLFKAYLQQMLNIVRLKGGNNTFYGIIITYKEFYLSSMDEYNDILKDEIENICKKNGWDENPLPLENVLVISIDNWDAIVELLKKRKIYLPTFLSEVVRKNQISKNNVFRSFLEQYDNQMDLCYLKEENEKLRKIF